MKHQSEPTTVTLDNDSAEAVRIMSRVFGQSCDRFAGMILKKFFLDQMEDRYERVRMVAELLTEVKYETRPGRKLKRPRSISKCSRAFTVRKIRKKS
jgi:hypothetical protein